jgi:hypothetical protein
MKGLYLWKIDHHFLSLLFAGENKDVFLKKKKTLWRGENEGPAPATDS